LVGREQITHIATEATGVYWKPVWHILAGGKFELILANAAHVKNVPGRKTDVSDAEWLADLLATVSSAQASCRMPRPRSCAPASSWFVSSRATFCASKKRVTRLTTVPGVKALAAQVVLCEIRLDMNRFPSDRHLIYWACIDERAGKRRSNRLRKGATWLKTTLVQSAWAAVNKKDSYLRAQFYRIKVRRGTKKAIMAVAAFILTAIYHMLKDGTTYQDLGSQHFEPRFKLFLC
jgi:transposase